MAQEFDENNVPEETPANPGADVEMAEDVEAGDAPAAENANGNELPFAEGDASEPRVTFASYLMSPIVTLLIGSSENQTILTAHQSLLSQSPYFDEICKVFVDDGSVCTLQLSANVHTKVDCSLTSIT